MNIPVLRTLGDEGICLCYKDFAASPLRVRGKG